MRALVSEIAIAEAESETHFENIGPAPQYYWKQFHEADTTISRERFAPFQSVDAPITLPSFRELRVTEPSGLPLH